MTSAEDMIESEESFFQDGEYLHRLTLKSGRTVTGFSPISAQVAAWNAMIRLEMLCEIENGEIYH